MHKPHIVPSRLDVERMDDERYCGQCRQWEEEVERLTLEVEHHRVMSAARQEEVERLTLWKQDIESQTALVMDEECGTDERHCTCVPILRREVERLRALLHGLLEQPDVMSSAAGFPRSPDGYVWQLYWVRRDALQAAREAAGGDDE